MYVQAILINKHKLNKTQAIKYVKDMRYHPLKIHETENYYRFRIYRPDVFKRFRTKRINDILTIVFAEF